ncbi:MAG TPA: hypothetical protein VFI25_10890 [Planctomycetota bacterium]|jgi:hypothetical protein|nr:hypothetical protein [Planctomycetota bacterium]
MDENLLFSKWDMWLEAIYADLLGLAVKRHIYREVGGIIERNRKIQIESSFYDWLAEVYATAMAVGVRRQVDRDRDSISMVNLLLAIEASPTVLSRTRYLSHFEPTSYDLERGNREFDRLAGSGHPSVDPDTIARDRSILGQKAEGIVRYVNRKIAHRDRRNLDRLPTFAELDDCLEYLFELVKKYLLLFRCATFEVLPVWQFDWTAIFRQPWIEEASEPNAAEHMGRDAEKGGTSMTG